MLEVEKKPQIPKGKKGEFKKRDIIVKKYETKTEYDKDGNKSIKRIPKEVNLTKKVNESKKLIKKITAEEKLNELERIFTK